MTIIKIDINSYKPNRVISCTGVAYTLLDLQTLQEWPCTNG